jgi:zinc-binding alcohol dehydrogenase/oxidoreductase
MLAIVQREIGGPEVLHLEEIADPTPGPGEATVRLRAAALNRRDVWIRIGQYAGIVLPCVPGSDGAGVVESVGQGVDGTLVGQEVVIDPAMDWGDEPRVQGSAFRILGLPDQGTYAQVVKAPAANLYRRPKALSWEESAALPLAGLTAYRALVTRGHLHPGETVLIPGVGGGVSSFVLLFAVQLGARVLVTSGSDAKLERARALGAEGTFNYRDPEWVKQVRAASGGNGPDLIVESIGGEAYNQFLDVARPGGRVVSYGSTLGAVPNLVMRRIFWKQLDLLGSTMGRPEEFGRMLALFADGTLRPIVDTVLPLAEATQFGKIVLSIGQ